MVAPAVVVVVVTDTITMATILVPIVTGGSRIRDIRMRGRVRGAPGAKGPSGSTRRPRRRPPRVTRDSVTMTTVKVTDPAVTMPTE